MMKSGQIIHFGNPQEITSEINGQVWECTVPTAYAEKYAASYNTSNLRNTSENQTKSDISALSPLISILSCLYPLYTDVSFILL